MSEPIEKKKRTRRRKPVESAPAAEPTTATPVEDERVIRRKWNRPQTIFRRIKAVPGGPLLYKDIEGAIGSGKTTAPAWMTVEYATNYQGIHICLAAWTDEMLGPPKTAFLTAAREQGFSVEANNLTWHGGQGEDYYLFEGYDSRVYIRSLKASEDDMRILKLAGLSLSIIWIDQPEPVPEDVYRAYIPARLRQPGFPHEVWLSPNPLDEDHWLSKEFPTEPGAAKPHHHYIHVELRDNVANVGAQFIADMELAHPPGSPNRNLQVDGNRGPSLRGKPVYGGYFDRQLHVDASVKFDPAYPLLTGWDFGEEKPAATFWQYIEHLGAIRILGAVKGENLFLELFAPKVLEIQSRWFPSVPAGIWPWCDPTGDTGNGGMQYTPVQVLKDHGVPVRFDPRSNQAPVRYGAIQTIGGFMRRLAKDGLPAFLMHPRCIELVLKGGGVEERESNLLVQAFNVGYCWSELAAPDSNPNIRKPKKGTRYDDLMNAGEYIVIGQRITVPSDALMLQADRRLAILAQRHARAAEHAERRPTLVGPTGETLPEQYARIQRELKHYKDHDISDWRHGKGRHRNQGSVYPGRRGGC